MKTGWQAVRERAIKKATALRQATWRWAFNHATKPNWKSSIFIVLANFLIFDPWTLFRTFGISQSVYMLQSPPFARMLLGACICGTALTIAICFLWRWVILHSGPANARAVSVTIGLVGSYLLFGAFAWIGQVLSTQMMAMFLLFETYAAWSRIILEPWANSTVISVPSGASLNLNVFIFDADYLLGAAVIFVLL